MDSLEAIARRHSYRGAYLPQPVPRADLARIVDAGIRAPSGYNAQTTSFVVVDDPSLLRQIADMHPDSQPLQTAPALIAVLMKNLPAEGQIFFGTEDYAAATENILLAITALGYAGLWLDGWLRREGRAEAVARLLGVPDTYTVRVVVPVGVPAESRAQRERLPFDQRAWFNRYGAAG